MICWGLPKELDIRYNKKEVIKMAYTKAERKKAAKKAVRTKRKRYGKDLRRG
jgi:hypothetical protein